MKVGASVFSWASCLVSVRANAAESRSSPRLKISPNRRFLVQHDGTPFFYLGDTAWELFHRLNREEADRYLENRARKGFTVIQAVALAELDGLNTPNAYGHRPLIDNDPAKPDVKDGPGTITGTMWTTSWSKPTRWACSSASCPPGVTNGIRNGAWAAVRSRRRTRPSTASGWAVATRTRRSSGFSAATARSKRTSTARSSGRWPAA